MFHHLRYDPRRLYCSWAIDSLFLLLPLSSTHCTLKISENDKKKMFCQRPGAHLDERSRPQTFSRAHRCLTALTLGFEFGTQCSWRRVEVLYLYNSRSLIASAFTVRVLRVSATFGCVGSAQVHNHETMQTSSSP